MVDKISEGEDIKLKKDEDSDDSPPLGNLDLVRIMYESIKNVALAPETKPNKEKHDMERSKKADNFYWRSDVEPDRSKTDFYCKVCDAHMNSEDMWESHVSGKRHLKNLQKLPGEMPSQARAVKTNAKAELLDAIEGIREPIVGLEYITELQRYDPCLKPSYTCHLCQANCTWSVVVEHILTTKHRLAYIKAVAPDQYKMISNMGLKTLCLDQLAEDQAREYEEKRGCGEIEVKLEKFQMTPPSPRKYKPYPVLSPRRSPSVSSETSFQSPSYHRSKSRSSRRRHSSPYRSRRYSSSSSSEDERLPRHRVVTPVLSEVEIRKLSTSSKIKLMQKLCKSIHPIPRSLAEEIPGIITNLTTEILRYKIRQLPLSAQNKLAKYIATEEQVRFYHNLIPDIEDIFSDISIMNLNSYH